MIMKRFILFVLTAVLVLSQCAKGPDYSVVTLKDTMESYEAGPIDPAFLVGKVWHKIEYKYDERWDRWNRWSGDGSPVVLYRFEEGGTVRTNTSSDGYGSCQYSITPGSNLLTIDGQSYVTYPVSDEAFLIRLDDRLSLFRDMTGIWSF